MTRIMVVEDEPLVAADVGARIEALGYELGPTALTGEEALRMARETPVDLVLMDIRLEGGLLDGIDTATRLRRELHVPVVFLTAFADKQTLQRAVEAEPLGYLLKPFTDAEVAHTIEQAVLKLHGLRAREEREAWLDSAFRSLADATILLDEHHRIVRINSVAETFAGVSNDEVAGKAWTEVFPLASPADGGGDALVERARRENAAVSAAATMKLRTRDGGEIPVEFSAMGVRLRGGSASGVALVLHDARTQPRIDSEVSMAERLSALGSFASGLAHEINNPLAASMVGLELAGRQVNRLQSSPAMLAGGRVDEPLERLQLSLGTIGDALRRIEALMKDLSLFARPGVERRPIDPAEVLSASIRLVESQLRHRARLVCDVEAGGPLVDANESQLARAFVSLLENAADSIPEGDAERNEIRASLHAGADGFVTIEISDTGAGMTPDRMVRMYEPFYTTKAVGAGMGLGLAICHSVVTAHRGTISARSEPGRGTTFTVRLPTSTAGARVETAPSTVSPRRRMRMLIVDDEPIIGTLLATAFGDAHDVTTAVSARDALEEIRRDARFDVVLTDLAMPQMDGIAFYETVQRENPDLASRFVFMSGGAFTPRAERFLESVPGRFMLKPLRLDELEKMLLAAASAPTELAD